jgi:hypothetical protein
MSYAPPPEARRPAPVTVASVLLVVMGAGGLAYGVSSVAVLPGVLRRFRAAAQDLGAGPTDVDGFVAVLRTVAWSALVLGVALFAVLLVAALGLRKGRRGARTGVWVLCGLGLVGGIGAAVAVALQRGIPTDLPGNGLGPALAAAYPAGWVGLNVALALGQIVGYAAVALLVGSGSGTWFARPPGPAQAAPAAPWTPPGVYAPSYLGPAHSPGFHPSAPPPAPPGPPPLPPDAAYWARPASPDPDQPPPDPR